MQSLERFESFVERLMEGSFARLFRSPIQPAEVAKRLEREMEAHPTISVGRTYVPNYYEVTLHPEDYAEFEPFRHSLEHNMAEFISDLAAERGYSLVARPRVVLQAGDDVPKRGIEVAAHLTDEQGGGAPAQSGAKGSNQGQTERVGAKDTPVTRTHAMPKVPRNRPVAASNQGTSAPSAVLRPLSGDLQGRDFAVNKTLLTMGRGLDNDFVIDDPRVSRHHAQLTYRHNHYLLRDLRSTNGTFVNGEPVEAVVLATSDIVSLGGFELSFTEE